MVMTASGGIPAIIKNFTITAKKKSFTIHLPATMQGLDTPLLRRRIDAICDNRKIKIRLVVE